MIARPDHLTIRPNPACRIGFAGLNPSCKLTTRPAQVICPSGSLLTGVSSLISAFPTPSLGGRFVNGSGASRGEGACVWICGLPSLRAQRSNPYFLSVAAMDCFAALAMTALHLNVFGCLKIESSQGSDRSGLKLWLGVAATAARSLSPCGRGDTEPTLAGEAGRGRRW